MLLSCSGAGAWDAWSAHDQGMVQDPPAAGQAARVDDEPGLAIAVGATAGTYYAMVSGGVRWARGAEPCGAPPVWPAWLERAVARAKNPPRSTTDLAEVYRVLGGSLAEDVDFDAKGTKRLRGAAGQAVVHLLAPVLAAHATRAVGRKEQEGPKCRFSLNRGTTSRSSRQR